MFKCVLVRALKEANQKFCLSSLTVEHFVYTERVDSSNLSWDIFNKNMKNKKTKYEVGGCIFKTYSTAIAYAQSKGLCVSVIKG